MTFPTIHLNGTSARELIKIHERAFDAIQDALTALCACRPNGRDYYPQGPGALSAAIDEAIARENALQEVIDELHEIINHIERNAEERK